MSPRGLVVAFALCRCASASALRPPPPCAATQHAVLQAVVSKLPPGTFVTSDQLRSMCGLWARELSGEPLKQLSGSWELAVADVFSAAADAQTPLLPVSLPPPQPAARGRRRRRGRSSSSRSINERPPPPGALVVPSAPIWEDPRPPPALETTCLGELVEGSTTWLTNDCAACEELLEECGFDEATHVGLDLEWTPTMVRGQHTQVALLQIATRRHCILLRVGQMALRAAAPSQPAYLPLPPPPLPPKLVALLGSTETLKVGRGIRDDAKLIRRQLGVDVSGLLELPGRKNLKDTAREATDLQMPDAAKWMTNWDATDLSTSACTYAAFDAIAAYEVHRCTPPPPQQQLGNGGSRAAKAERPRATQFPRPQRQSRRSGSSSSSSSSSSSTGAATSPAASASPRQSAEPTRAEAETSAGSAAKGGSSVESNRAQRRAALAELRGEEERGGAGGG